MFLVIGEKPSVSQTLAKILKAEKKGDGYLAGKDCLVSWCFGHLAEYASPESYDERYAKWDFSDLPIIPEEWKLAVAKDKKAQLPQAVDDDMHMDVAAPVMPVCVGADKGLMSGEILFAVFKTKLLCMLPGQSAFLPVFRVEADDVMVGFDFVIRPVFMEAGIQFFAFHIKAERVAVHPVKIIFFPELHVPVFIKDRFSGVLVVLENEISLRFPVVCILTCYVFEYRHGNPLPSLPLHISFRKSVQYICLLSAAFPVNGFRPD